MKDPVATVVGRLRVAVVGLCLSFLTIPTSADWLVTNDRVEIETRGAWTTAGDFVTFTLPNGTFSSMRLADLDLDVSRALTEEMANPRSETPAPASKPKAVIVITDADMPSRPIGPDPSIDASAEASSSEASVPTPATSRVELEIVDWEQQIDASNATLEIIGTMVNPRANPATRITLDVLLYDEEGSLLSTEPALIDNAYLAPGSSSGFKASFTDVLHFDRAEFQLQSRGFVYHPAGGAEPSDGG